jgi:hypothetical protein
LKVLFYIFLILISAPALRSQTVDTDTSDVVIRKTKKETPQEYNISDVIIKQDKEKTKNIIRVDLDIPLKTTMKLVVSDTAGATIMYLINDQTLSPGVYRVKWEMPKCKTSDCDYPRGSISVSLKRISSSFKEIFI